MHHESWSCSVEWGGGSRRDIVDGIFLYSLQHSFTAHRILYAVISQPFDVHNQSQKGKKSLEVKKNRFDGDLGEVFLTFDSHSSRLREQG